MKLWVRSQDKERLMNPIDFYIEETIDYANESSEFDIFALNFANDDVIIGRYKTKERALEVLDEIEERIMLINTINMAKDTNSLIACKNVLAEEKIKGLNYPYQMPEN